jgi:predicted Zn-dependent peptidase
VPDIPFPLVSSGSSDEPWVVEEAGGAVVRRSVLPGGVRVLTERMPGLRSVTFGCWLGVGSRDETEGHYGSTHFLEHLLFKGTARRSGMEIASAFDVVGGEANAATGKEHTFYYARVRDEDLPVAVDLITDMVTSARLDGDDLDSERGVILTELAMHDDDPADVVHERFLQQVFGDHPLGRPTGGTPRSVSGLSRPALVEHYQRTYQPPGLVVTAAGNVDHDALCGLVTQALSRGGWDPAEARTPWPRRPTSSFTGDGTLSGTLVVPRPVEQAHLILGGPGLHATDERRFTLSVLNAILGGGSSSRLFQQIREQRGLAYDVYSFSGGYSDRGYFGLYAGCAPEHAQDVLSLLDDAWARLAEHGPTEEELRRAHGQVCGGLVLGLEDSSSRMSRLGRAELVHGSFLGLAEILDRIRSVTAEQVRELLAELASRPRTLTVVGPFDADRDFALPPAS